MLQEDALVQLNSFLTNSADKIAVYGLKLNAQAVYWNFPERIFCFLDRDLHSGSFCGLPIIQLEDLPRYDIHAIVIAASLPAEQHIYKRIQRFCGNHNITLYGLHSGRLACERCGQNLSVSENPKEALCRAITEHEVISFDIFDTLLMRKVLYPTDVFDIVEHRLRRHGMDVPGFKNYRVQAERGDCPYKDYVEIYRTLKDMLGWTNEQMEIAMHEELEVERQVIIPRPGMAEIVSYAQHMGKKVLLVSDMYLSPEFLQDILSNYGLKKYDKIYVSASYGTNKGEQLFELVRQQNPAQSYLHIGDNEVLDGGAANIRGFDTWIVSSSLQVLKKTDIGLIIPFVENLNDRLLLGLFTAKAYSNPFEPLHIGSVAQFAQLFLAPMAAQYVLWLLRQSKGHHFDAILFASRDGWLFHRIYKDAVDLMGIKNNPKSIYFYCSRKLCISAALKNEKSLEWMREILAEQTHHFLREVFDFVPKDGHEPPPQGENPDLIWSDVLEKKEDIFTSSTNIKKGYEHYITKQGICYDGHYAFTDLCSQGTTQSALTQSILPHLYGFIFARYLSSSYVTMGRMESFLPQADSAHMFANIAYEFVFSSSEPSVASVDIEGNIIFEEEDRSPKEMKIFQEAQNAVVDFCHEFFSLCDLDSAVNPAVGQFMLSMYQKSPFIGSSSVFDGLDIKDDLRGTRLDCLLPNEK